MTEDDGRLTAHQVEHVAAALVDAHRGEPLDERPRSRVPGPGPAARGRPSGRRDQILEYGGSAVRAPQGGEIEPQRRRVGGARPQSGVEQGEALLGREGDNAAALGAPTVGIGQVRGHAVALLPQSPADRRRRQAGCGAVGRERVEEPVRCRVVGLARRSEDRGRRREQHECRQVQVAGEFMQVPGRVDLRPQHTVQAVGGQRADHAVIEDAGGVHDRDEPGVRADRRERVGELVTVGDVACRKLHLGAELDQLVAQRDSPRRVRAGPAHQHQVPRAVPDHQMPRDEGTERAGRTGNQNGASAVTQQRAGDLAGGFIGGGAGCATRHRQNDLSDVAGLAEVAQGIRGIAHRDGLDLRRPA